MTYLYGYLTQLVASSRRREEGQTMAEYGVILAVITVFIVVALGALALAIEGNILDVVGTLVGA